MNKPYLSVICYIFSHDEALFTLSSQKVTFDHFGLKSLYREAMKETSTEESLWVLIDP